MAVRLLEFDEKAVAEARTIGSQLLQRKCDYDWAPCKCGGFNPKAYEYGIVPIPSQLFANDSGEVLTSWHVPLRNGHQVLFKGRESRGCTPEDFKTLFIGLNFRLTIPQISFDSMGIQIADRRFPTINLGELNIYQHPTLIFPNPLLIDEEVIFEVTIDLQIETSIMLYVIMLGETAFRNQGRIEYLLLRRSNPASSSFPTSSDLSVRPILYNIETQGTSITATLNKEEEVKKPKSRWEML